jgi:dihydrofolate reductase
MKIILVAVTSINGKLTKGDPSTDSGQASNIYTWTSKEDQTFFSNLIHQNNLIVMGAHTYEAVKDQLKLSEERLRVIMTRNPDKYSQNEIKGQLEFTQESPDQIVKRLEQKGYKQMLVVGGGQINTLFLKSRLIDEIYLTLEPKVFGKGTDVVSELGFEADLELMSMEKLNAKGTILLKYKVIK